MQVGGALSSLGQMRDALKDEYLDIDIWDETNEDYLQRHTLELNRLRETYLRAAFSSLLIPRVNKHFFEWSIADAFSLEQTTL